MKNKKKRSKIIVSGRQFARLLKIIGIDQSEFARHCSRSPSWFSEVLLYKKVIPFRYVQTLRETAGNDVVEDAYEELIKINA